MSTLGDSSLGKQVPLPGHYDPALLFALPRAPARQTLGIRGQPPFTGADMWTAFEVGWLNPRGKPQIAIAHIAVPCDSPNIIESKSLKLYLNSLNNERLESASALRQLLHADLNEALWRGSSLTVPPSATIRLNLPQNFGDERLASPQGLSLDRLDTECTHHDAPAPELLTISEHEAAVTETLTSNLLRSACPVTGQPDWASVRIDYSGAPINHGGLLRYIVSFRNHSDFHEHCVERMFMDIWQHCQPARLSIAARYTRRGGIDINPWRTSHPQALPPNVRTPRQ